MLRLQALHIDCTSWVNGRLVMTTSRDTPTTNIRPDVSSPDPRPVVIHLVVVGFHHKKGCQVEYCYPPFHSSANGQTSDRDQSSPDGSGGQSGPVPDVWKTLPQLALPDGAHNHQRDSIYFHLPDRDDHQVTIFGVSCYRQIQANQLITKDESVTRSSVQKSVVVLSRLPLYGLIEAKLELITHAYFKELDFSKVSLLEETYHNLNAQLHHELIHSSEVFLGLSTRQLIQTFGHQTLTLFKLLLLERKVLFIALKSPVKQLCVTLLSLVSLFPGQIQFGLNSSAISVHPRPGRQSSTDLQLSPGPKSGYNPEPDELNEYQVVESKDDENEVEENDTGDGGSKSKLVEDEDEQLMAEIDEVLSQGSDTRSESSNSHHDQRHQDPRTTTFYMPAEDSSRTGQETPPLLKLSLDCCGFPLQLFACASHCHPYLSLSYLDVIQDVRLRSCLVGATNFLFKQKRTLFDVIVEVDSGKVEIIDLELKKQLALTTEDLRFAEYLCRNVNGDQEAEDLFNEGTNWEGGDDWLRYQFKVYLLHLLRTSESDETSRDFASFNCQFMAALKSTHNYKYWSSASHPGVFEVIIGHPFFGHYTVSDVKLRLSHVLAGSERSKKINQTVSQTSKTVGVAVNNAKTALSSWWSSWAKNDKENGERKQQQKEQDKQREQHIQTQDEHQTDGPEEETQF